MAVNTFKFRALATKALRTIGSVGQGVPLTPNDLQVAFEAANDMLDAWAAQRVTIFQCLMNTFPLVADQGSDINPYTIGPGGDFDVVRPTYIADATLLVTTSDPPFEYGLTILKDDEYAGLSLKRLGSGLCNALYYNGRFPQSGVTVGLGQIYLYPVPDGSAGTISLRLYLPTPLSVFADTDTTEYAFPFGYAEALRYQLAKRLAVEFGKPITPEHAQLAQETWAVIAGPNAQTPNLRSDVGIPGVTNVDGLYNWRTGTGG